MDRDATPPSPPQTVLEQVQRSAPAGSAVTEAGFAVPGVEMFRIADGKPLPKDAYPTYEFVAVVGGLGQPILNGDDAMRAVIKATQDPAKLSEIALAINRRPAMLLQAPKDEAQRKEGVAAPKLANGAVDFWIMTGSPGLTLMHGRLDLATAKLELEEPAVSDDQAIEDAIAGLRQANFVAALETLKKNCKNPKASKALFDAIATGVKDDLRARAAMASEACGPTALDPLIKALETDKALSVRATAANVLGKLHDKRAKPALEKASKDKDSYLASVATEALQKLQ